MCNTHAQILFVSVSTRDVFLCQMCYAFKCVYTQNNFVTINMHVENEHERLAHVVSIKTYLTFHNFFYFFRILSYFLDCFDLLIYIFIF
jgi:hypothetical protein